MTLIYDILIASSAMALLQSPHSTSRRFSNTVAMSNRAKIIYSHNNTLVELGPNAVHLIVPGTRSMPMLYFSVGHDDLPLEFSVNTRAAGRGGGVGGVYFQFGKLPVPVKNFM